MQSWVSKNVRATEVASSRCLHQPTWGYRRSYGVVADHTPEQGYEAAVRFRLRAFKYGASGRAVQFRSSECAEVGLNPTLATGLS
jgi:hypothetical protein